MVSGVTLGPLNDFKLVMVSTYEVINPFDIHEPFFGQHDLVGLLVVVMECKFRHHDRLNVMVELVLVEEKIDVMKEHFLRLNLDCEVPNRV